MSETVNVTNYIVAVDIEGTDILIDIAPTGPTGEGVPAGGTTGQTLIKTTDGDYDTEWVDRVASVNGDTGAVKVYDGGAANDLLAKVSATDYDTEWTDEITVDRISYDITADETLTAEGQTAWDADARTLAINKGNGVVQNVTQELNYAPARNTEATALQRGELVMVDPAQPAQGMTLRLKRYISNGTYPVDLFVGMVSEVIEPNQTGFVEWFGRLSNLSLSALQPVGETWVEGDILWPDPLVAGGMTKVEPTAPAHKVTVAAILRITGQNVLVQLRPNLRSRIVDLHDVDVSGAADGDAIVLSNGVWGATAVEPAWTVTTANSGTLTGVNVIWLADTSAARNRTLDVNGERLQVKDVTGQAGTNNITLTAGSGQTINGNATEVIDVNYGWVEYVRSGTNWVTIGGQA